MANTVNFFINLAIGTGTLRLDGDVIKDAANNGLDVTYHADSFAEAYSLGTIDQATAAIQSALAGFGIQTTDLDLTSKISGVPFLSGVVTAIENTEVRITDLTLNTTTKECIIGLGFVLPANFTLPSPFSLGLQSFGFVLKHTAK